ncbi:MAG: AAA family ATPase [Gordonia sp. (in: high G+C Gram-positive bacteria)]|uniref:AAA family ATPase n=1 Tax=Gordonia sp. (in: high G+C Gram-positive bacteria) TaxID=84139 RepID=UPI0039E5A20B
MLVWINGPFGAGKTQTAFEIHRRLPGSEVCDPELPGFGLNRMLPPDLRGDFQDFPAWRQGVYEVLDRVLRARDGIVVAPMTITDPTYLDETVGRLRNDGHDIRHVTLLAEPDTVRARLESRTLPFQPPDDFAIERIEPCLESLHGPAFAEHVITDGLTVPQVAERIADLTGIRLAPDSAGPLRRRVRQTLVSLRHIRFD